MGRVSGEWKMWNMSSEETISGQVMCWCLTWCSSIQSQWLWDNVPSRLELSWLASTSLNKAFIDVTTSVCNSKVTSTSFHSYRMNNWEILLIIQLFNSIATMQSLKVNKDCTEWKSWPGCRDTSLVEGCSPCPPAARNCLLHGESVPATV